MKVLHALDEYKDISPTTVTMGAFDGVHTGHQKVLSQLKQVADTYDTKSVVITFEPHPRLFFNPDASLQMLSDIDEKAKLLTQQGIDYLIIQKFDKSFADKSPEELLNDLLNKLKMKYLLMGYDHSFGKNKKGNLDFVQDFAKHHDLKIHLIDAFQKEDRNISSTLIREMLQKGEVQTANRYLGYEYSIYGTVVKGNQLGRTIGFPTANIAGFNKEKILPKQGVYIVKTLVDKKNVYGMMNLGLRPTVDGKKQVLEVYLFDFNKDIYGKKIKVSFLKRLRSEQKFSSVEALKKQLIIDEATSRAYIKSL